MINSKTKIIFDSDCSVVTPKYPYQNDSIKSNSSYKSDEVHNNIDTE